MDSRIEKLIQLTKEKWGLNEYYLHSHSIDQRVTSFNDTYYTLSMEWFPNGAEIEEGLNPDGTASISLNIHSGKYESIIFVGGVSYAAGVCFQDDETHDIIQWVETETGLTNGQDFQLEKEEEGHLYFRQCLNGKPVSPSGYIELRYDDFRRLTFFSVYHQQVPGAVLKEEEFTLSIAEIEELVGEQLQFIHFPNYDEQLITPAYAIEEIYIRNHLKSTIEYTLDDRNHLEIKRLIEWTHPSTGDFEKREMFQRSREYTAEQAFLKEPSIDTLPITEMEQEKCISAVEEVVSKLYPAESGKWELKTLHRDNGSIYAVVKSKVQTANIFKRKILVMIDKDSFEPLNYMDTSSMMEMYDAFDQAGEVMISKKQALKKIHKHLELKPIYVYNHQQNAYVLCGMLDCQYAVNAVNGKVVPLADL